MNNTQIKEHYNEDYFLWQKKTGIFTGKANQVKFREFAKPDFNVLDFGCGGGFMLHGLNVKGKMGIEINPTAQKQAKENGLTVYSTLDEAPQQWADLIISDHALEHVPNPLEILQKLKSKLKPDGKVVFVIPCEHIDMPFDQNDINQHLYSWGPQSLGNLFKHAGFKVISSKPFYHRHFPYCHHVRPIVGEKIFNLICNIYGRLNTSKSNEVRLIATTN